jgi:hypothetical protein
MLYFIYGIKLFTVATQKATMAAAAAPTGEMA